MSGNRLAQETSPYLRQHADNPVDWWAWGPEAFDNARQTGRPVLVSIGYAACHWCHVMAHESFEDAGTAEVMNELFVNIKVDREERPDVDQIHMAALHALGEPGGWPLTMFLTPDGAPFWGGTYFPKEARWGKQAFVTVLRGISDAFHNRPADIASNADALQRHLTEAARGTAQANVDFSLATLDELAGRLLTLADPVNGGIKGAPKFPNAGLIECVWRAWSRSGDQRFADAFLLTMTRICQGGIYDHIGGGFARYSVDERWLAPHFEKMLYDNAQLLDLLNLAWSMTGDDLYRRRVRETVGWLEREMLLPGGAFASSLDADSEGREGAFYVWTSDVLRDALGDDFDRFATIYDVQSDGNWEEVTILNQLHSGVLSANEDADLAPLRARLLDLRERRPRPGRDDKILADWNGLVIAALARAGRTFGQPQWITLARNAFAFVVSDMDRAGRLGHSAKDGGLVFPGFATDQAAMARAALALYDVTDDRHYLHQAENWLAALLAFNVSDDALYLTASDADALIVRPRAHLDEATPSALGMACEGLLRLAALSGSPRWSQAAEMVLEIGQAELGNNAFQLLSVLNAIDLRLAGLEIIVVGDGVDAAALETAAKNLPFPIRSVLAVATVDDLPAGHIARSAPPSGRQAVALVCNGERCGLPVHDAEALRASAVQMRQNTPART